MRIMSEDLPRVIRLAWTYMMAYAGARSNTELFKTIEGKVPEIYLVGDCVEPRRIYHAIHEGHAVAQQV